MVFAVAITAVSLLMSGVAVAQDVPVPDGETSDQEEAELVVASVERDRSTGEVTAEVVVPVALAGEPLPDGAITVIVGNTRQTIDYTPISGDDLEVVLVIDISGSMQGEPLDAAKAASTSFVNLLPAGVEVAVVTFDQTAEVVSQRSLDRSSPIEAIQRLEVGGETALFDALILATSEFSTNTDAKRVVVVLTDGGDSASVSGLEDARAALRSAGVVPYAVALATSESATENLEALVRSTDGRLEQTESTDALVPLYDELAAQLASRFTVRFTPGGDSQGTALMLVNSDGVLAGAELQFARASTQVVEPSTSASVAPPEREISPVPVRSPEEHTSMIGSWAVSSTAMYAGISAVSVTLFLVGLLISFPSARMSLIADRGRNAASSAHVSDVTGRLEGAADRLLARKGRERRLARALEKAGLALRPAEFIVMAGSIAVAVGMFSGLLFGLWAGFAMFFAALLLARLNVNRLAKKRSRKFIDQLPGTLQLMAGGLRAGYALSQAVEHVATETEAPTSDEFHRLSTEVRLGRDFSQSMHAMSDRLDAEDFAWVVHAIDIHREVGGDLAEVLDKVGATMRDRNFVRRQVAAVSAEGRYSAYMITSLPFVVAIILAITNPAYIGRLVEDARGYMVILAACTQISIGTVWMRNLVKVKY